MRMRSGIFAVVVALGAFFVVGCAPSTCENVCQRWSECVDTPSGGVEGCANECDAKAEDDAVYRGHVEECWQCAEPVACSEAENKCALDCVIAVAR